MDLKIHCILLVVAISGSRGHLLPQALEDVHAFVQSELQQRSQGHERSLGIESPPQGGPQFQTTTTYIGVPVMIQNEMKLDGKGGVQKISDDLATAQTQNIATPQNAPGPSPSNEQLARGLVPPAGPLPDLQGSSSDQIQIVPANIIGPSTYVSDAPPKSSDRPARQSLLSQPPSSPSAHPKDDRSKSMAGWIPIDNEGSRLAKAVGGKVQGEDSEDYKNVAYSTQQRNDVNNDATTTIVQLNDLVIGTGLRDLEGSSRKVSAKYPVYPGNSDKSAKVVIHAQNVIIRDDSSKEEVKPTPEVVNTTATQIRQFPAYSMVPQLNHYLRDQLRIAAMNQLIQSHPLNGKAFPRPLSLREIAQAARNGQFPEEPLLQQATSMLTPNHMAINLPHVVRMQDNLPLGSIQPQTKFAFPGFGGLGSLYKNLLQQGQGGGPYDPRQPLDYSLLASLSGQRLKVPRVPTFKGKPDGQFSSDYGDSVAYTGGSGGDDAPTEDDNKKNKEPIQIVSAGPSDGGLGPIMLGGLGVGQLNLAQRPQSGSLKAMSEELLKQMIIEELEAGGGSPPQQGLLPFRPRPGGRPSFGVNAHPFAYLATSNSPDSVHEGSYEYGYPANAYIDDSQDSPLFSFGKSPKPSGLAGLFGGAGAGPLSYSTGGDPYSYGGGGGDVETPGIMPLNKDTIMDFGKGLLHTAMDFSKKHNPMTLISKIRSLPPVKFEFYRQPVGIPDQVLDKFTQNSSGGGGGEGPRPGHGPGPGHGPRPGPRPRPGPGGKRGRRRHLPRKNNPKHY